MSDTSNSLSAPARALPHSSHWGAFSVRARDGAVDIIPHPDDPAPSPLLANIPAAVSHSARVARPMIRRGWLEKGPGPDERRGRDELVPVSWPEALDRLAAELRRVYAEHGPQAVFGGSYGWASAGRFHDAQHQLHRFLNLAGGYVRSVNSYSSGAASVLLPHVIGPQGFGLSDPAALDLIANIGRGLSGAGHGSVSSSPTSLPHTRQPERGERVPVERPRVVS